MSFLFSIFTGSVPGNISYGFPQSFCFIFFLSHFDFSFFCFYRDIPVDRLKSQIFILNCTQRKSALRQLRIDCFKKFEYCLPYFYNPLKQDDLEQNTGVPILYAAEPKPVFCQFDLETDEIEEFHDSLVADGLITDEELSEDQKDAFKEFVKEKVREAKRTNKEAREARKKAVEEMSDETRHAFESKRFYKFYPVKTPDAPDVSNLKENYINRYYGRAHKAFLCDSRKDEVLSWRSRSRKR